MKDARLTEWFASVGIKHKNITLFSNPAAYGDDSLGISAKADIEEGQLIGTIPKSAIISAKTSSLGPFLEENKIGGTHTKLTMCPFHARAALLHLTMSQHAMNAWCKAK